MVDYVIHNKRSRDFLNWSRDTFTPDEHFWASLNSLKFNRHLLTPGGNRGKYTQLGSLSYMSLSSFQ